METILLTHVICVKFWIYVLLSNFLNISDNLNYANLQNGFDLSLIVNSQLIISPIVLICFIS